MHLKIDESARTLADKVRDTVRTTEVAAAGEALADVVHQSKRIFSVLQDWVMELPIREQGTLICAIRGCDVAPKFPLNSFERRLVACIRGHVLNPADPREIDFEPGSFMSRHPLGKYKISSLGHYPQHWVSHVMHAVQIIGERHPEDPIREEFAACYAAFCESFHVAPESREAMIRRLSEDRVATGSVVS